MTSFDTLADINVLAMERQIGALERAHPDTSAATVCQVIVDLLRSYQRALRSRDQAAAHLVRFGGWTWAQVAVRTCGHAEHADRSRTVTEPVDPPAHLHRPDEALAGSQLVCDQLRNQLDRAFAVAAYALPAARMARYLPVDPVERVAHCAQWLRYLSTFRSAIDASRDLAAAILVTHHGWPLSTTARIADSSEDSVTAAGEAARLNPPSAADSDLLREMGRLSQSLAHTSTRMLTARRHAVADAHRAGLPSAVVAAHGGFALV
jgi:hypothetical protein